MSDSQESGSVPPSSFSQNIKSWETDWQKAWPDTSGDWEMTNLWSKGDTSGQLASPPRSLSHLGSHPGVGLAVPGRDHCVLVRVSTASIWTAAATKIIFTSKDLSLYPPPSHHITHLLCGSTACQFITKKIRYFPLWGEWNRNRSYIFWASRH